MLSFLISSMLNLPTVDHLFPVPPYKYIVNLLFEESMNKLLILVLILCSIACFCESKRECGAFSEFTLCADPLAVLIDYVPDVASPSPVPVLSLLLDLSDL